jgi:hypothetical protein
MTPSATRIDKIIAFRYAGIYSYLISTDREISMQINGSAFQQGLAGFQTSQSNLTQASAKVAQAPITQSSMTESNNTDSSAIQDGLVDANSRKIEAQANAKVLETANKALGSIIDITA